MPYSSHAPTPGATVSTTTVGGGRYVARVLGRTGEPIREAPCAVALTLDAAAEASIPHSQSTSDQRVVSRLATDADGSV